jgi:hypothetical protein
MSSYEIVKAEFKRLCLVHALEIPGIAPSFRDDKCDVTYAPLYIRIKEQECESLYQARHLFGHYLADLHNTNDEQADIVADIIATILA